MSLAAYSGVGTKLQSFVEEYDLCVTLCACKLKKKLLHQCIFFLLLSGFEGLQLVRVILFSFECWCHGTRFDVPFHSGGKKRMLFLVLISVYVVLSLP